jgi:hypothetical protein
MIGYGTPHVCRKINKLTVLHDDGCYYDIIKTLSKLIKVHMSSDNKVRELPTVRFLWQQWTKTSVWCDDIGISAFHSCVVVDLSQSLSEWHLLLSDCVLVCRHENVGA